MAFYILLLLHLYSFSFATLKVSRIWATRNANCSNCVCICARERSLMFVFASEKCVCWLLGRLVGRSVGWMVGLYAQCSMLMAQSKKPSVRWFSLILSLFFLHRSVYYICTYRFSFVCLLSLLFCSSRCFSRLCRSFRFISFSIPDSMQRQIRRIISCVCIFPSHFLIDSYSLAYVLISLIWFQFV